MALEIRLNHYSITRRKSTDFTRSKPNTTRFFMLILKSDNRVSLLNTSHTLLNLRSEHGANKEKVGGNNNRVRSGSTRDSYGSHSRLRLRIQTDNIIDHHYDNHTRHNKRVVQAEGGNDSPDLRIR